MASPPSGSPAEEFDFIEEPSRDFFCPVTLDLLREPHQTLCCGNHISPEAVTTLQESGKPCPLCKKAGLKTLPDQFFKRQVNALKVRCPHKSAGCPWVGELGGRKRHFSIGSAEGKCKFEEIACEFDHAGCTAKLQRAKMADHKRHSVEEHLSMTGKIVRQQATMLQQQAATLQQQAATLQQQVNIITHLQQQMKQLVAHVKPGCESPAAESSSVVFTPPPVIIMTNFSRYKSAGNRWLSPPFYSHVGGYKMCIKVNPNGVGDGAGTHVSMFVYLMRGEYDNDLLWPFRGRITFQLVNRRADTGHVSYAVNYDDKTEHDTAGRVTEGERAINGWGLTRFTPHTTLCYDASKNTEFLVNDSLKIRVTAFKLTAW